MADTPNEDATEGTSGRAKMGRRSLLVGTAAAGVGAVVAMVASADPAEAANGNDVVLGSSTNKATATTAIATTKGFGLQASSSAMGQAGINGIDTASSLGHGVQGTSTNGIGVKGSSTNSHGVYGNTSSSTHYGVEGVDGSKAGGAGVYGTSSNGTGVAGVTASVAAEVAAVVGTVSSPSPGGYSAGIRGVNNGTGGLGIGVYGSHAGSGWGVYGYAPSGLGVIGSTSSGDGVSGSSESGDGVSGSSSTAQGVSGSSESGYGVFGSSGSGPGVGGSSNSTDGVVGSSGSGTGVHGSSTSGYGVAGNSPNNYAVIGVTTSGSGVYGQVSAAGQAGVVGRQTDAGGNWAIYGFGNIGATGTKSAVVPNAEGTGHVTLYCVESPECWFEDFGTASLSSGSVQVMLDPEFAQTIETETYHVFLQPRGDCNGLTLGAITAQGFHVKEIGHGTSDVAFSFRIVARRKDVDAPRLRKVTLPTAAVHQVADAPVIRQTPRANPHQ